MGKSHGTQFNNLPTMDELEVNSCIDIPSDKDYLFDDVFGAVEKEEDYVNLFSTEVYDQSQKNTPSTIYACTCYSAVHCVNEGNNIEGDTNSVDPVKIWKIALKRGAIIDKGWSLQGSQKIMRDLGHSLGHTRCPGLSDVKNALQRNQLVQTGSKSIDWVKTRANANIAVRGTSYGHAFIIQGYDNAKKHLICRNSYGPKNYDKGVFYVKYDDYDMLYSCYAYVDADSKKIIQKEQEKRRLAEAVRMGIWNGQRPDTLMSRLEAATIALRVGTKHDIWNGKDGDKTVLTRELVAMLERATGRKYTFVIKDLNKPITRKNGIILAVRI